MSTKNIIHKLATDQVVTEKEILLILAQIIKIKTKTNKQPTIAFPYFNYN